MRSDVGLHDLKHSRKGIVERMMRVMGRSGMRVVSLLPCFRGGVWGVTYCWNRCSSLLAFEIGSSSVWPSSRPLIHVLTSN
jgi:hypothetical protein